MAQSLSRIYVHLVFSTKNRAAFLDASWRPDLFAYLKGAFDAQKCYAAKIGGVEDHVHVLLDLHRTVTLSSLVGAIKSESSKWVKLNHDVPEFAWQAGYGAFSVSVSQRDDVKKYIVNQEGHHRTRTFQDEFRMLLAKYEIDFDERYVWD